VRAESETSRSPGIEVVSNGDRARRTEIRADGPVLLEGRCTLDGWLVGTGGLEDAVSRAVGGDLAELRGGAARIEAAVVLDDLWISLGFEPLSHH
jgi:hypothetical protein